MEETWKAFDRMDDTGLPPAWRAPAGETGPRRPFLPAPTSGRRDERRSFDAHPSFPRDSFAAFPRGAFAEIARPCRSATTSAKARTREWVLRFERRTPDFIEPLMGWTGGDDTLQQVVLTFPDKASAIAYAERQGLAYRMRESAEAKRKAAEAARRDEDEATGTAFSAWLTLAWLQARYGWCDGARMPDLEQALANPASVFAAPDEVVGHPLLPPGCKREILRRWAWDETLLDLAAAEGMPDAAPSRLAEVRAALARLEAEQAERPERADDAIVLVFASPGGTSADGGRTRRGVARSQTRDV